MIHLGVFFGGTSVEHEVSVITAQQAIAQLKNLQGYQVVPIYISKDNHWYTGDYLMEVEHFKSLETVIEKGQCVSMVKTDKGACLIANPLKNFAQNIITPIDIVFPMIHGTGGEDGNLQGFLEHMDIPYVGCNVLAASMTMDKIASKLYLQSAGIRVVDGDWFYAHEWLRFPDRIVKDLESKLGYPMIVKPADIGSSVGIKTAKNQNELREAIAFARLFTTRILVEKMLDDMREINISVLGDCEKLMLSVCEEPITDSDILTYEDKYMSEGGNKGMSASKRQIPAVIHPDILKEIRKMAADAFTALDCAGVIRIDFMIDNHTEKPYINEFNTVPGSLAFYLWEATNVTFLDMLKEAIEAAYRAYRRKKNIMRSNSVNLLSKKDLKGLKK